jgi:hypothetical protein
VIVHRDTSQSEFIRLGLPDLNPSDISIEVILSIETSNLKIAPIFSETQTKHFLLDDVTIQHLLENGPHHKAGPITHGKPQDAICFLRVEKMSLC